ncbi:hypothetical protein Btru_004363 [Bulinus truncatus]|nr:hypothetical protein Btru_004363 [Bulinus truncatus]
MIKGQGGGPIEDIRFSEDKKSAVITFTEEGAVDLILSRGDTVTVSGCALKVNAYYEENGIKTQKLKVVDLPDGITRDQLNILFKNKRNQGGGPIEEIQISDDEKSAVITFMETEAVDLILNRGDTVTVCGKVVQVSAYFEKNDFDSIDDQIQSDEEKLTSPDKKRMTYDEVKTKKLKVFDLPEDMTRDKLNILFKNKRGQGGGPIEDIQISDDEKSAVITFKETEAVDLILNRGDTVTVCGKVVQVSAYFEKNDFDSIDDQIQSDEEKLTSPDKKRMTYDEVKTKKLKVFDLPEDMTRDKLNILFKNKRGQGGGPIEDIQISDDEKSAVITFKETEAVDLILNRGDTVTVCGKVVQVSAYFEKNDFDSIDDQIQSDEEKLTSPDKKKNDV